MTSEDRGAAGPYIEYDNLPVLHVREEDLPLLHPYGTVEVGGRYVTPGGGRLTVRKDGKHLQITLDHLGCPAQLTKEKTALFRRLGLTAGCRHHASDAGAVLRSGLVQVTKRPSGVGPPRKFYALNDAGREEFAKFWAKWQYLSSRIDRLKEGGR